MSIELFGNIAAFVLYLSMMIFIGWRYMKNNESSGDFFLGGRKVGPWMTALSAEASDMSGWLLMGLPGLAYLGGMKEAFWTALGLITGGITVIVWHNLDGGLFAVYEILPAFLICLLTAIAVSLFDKNKDPQMLAEFDSCRKEKN